MLSLRALFGSALFGSALLVLVACGDDTSGGGGSGGSPSDGGGGAGETTGGGGTNAGGAQDGGGGADGGAGGEASGGGGAGEGGAGGAGGGNADYYGDISGECGTIDSTDIESPDPDYIDNTIDFSNRGPFDVSLLSPGGQEMYADGNLGGSSLYSEIFAYEVLYECDGAILLKTEGEIVYQTQGKKTDILLEIDGEKVGVSVVRALSFPEGDPYPVSQAFDVLNGKLADILQSSANVAPEDAWQKQILSVIAQTPDHAAAIAEAYTMVDDATKADTIVVVTVTEGEDDFIYYNN